MMSETNQNDGVDDETSPFFLSTDETSPYILIFKLKNQNMFYCSSTEKISLPTSLFTKDQMKFFSVNSLICFHLVKIIEIKRVWSRTYVSRNLSRARQI